MSICGNKKWLKYDKIGPLADLCSSVSVSDTAQLSPPPVIKDEALLILDGNTGLKQFFGDFLNMYVDYIYSENVYKSVFFFVWRLGLTGAAPSPASASAPTPEPASVILAFFVRFCIFFSNCSMGADGASSSTGAVAAAAAVAFTVTFLGFGLI